jgi:TRAP-type uncharacterized transport system fused permease subunit
LLNGFSRGAIVGAQIGVALALVGMMVKIMTTSGLGITISSIVEELAGGRLWLALLITMILSLVLGIGIPTLAAYALVAVVVAPVLIKMGVLPIAAHFFAFWFAIFSALTPPVAFASMAGAALSGGHFFKTSIEAFRLAATGFILPFLMVFNPVLLLHPKDPVWSTVSLLVIPLGFACTVCASYGYYLGELERAKRLLISISGIFLFVYCFLRSHIALFIGIGIFIFLTFSQLRYSRNQKVC